MKISKALKQSKHFTQELKENNEYLKEISMW